MHSKNNSDDLEKKKKVKWDRVECIVRVLNNFFSNFSFLPARLASSSGCSIVHNIMSNNETLDKRGEKTNCRMQLWLKFYQGMPWGPSWFLFTFRMMDQKFLSVWLLVDIWPEGMNILSSFDTIITRLLFRIAP